MQDKDLNAAQYLLKMIPEENADENSEDFQGIEPHSKENKYLL